MIGINKKIITIVVAVLILVTVPTAVYVVKNDLSCREGLRMMKDRQWDAALKALEGPKDAGYLDSEGLYYYCIGREFYDSGACSMAMGEFIEALKYLENDYYKKDAEGFLKLTESIYQKKSAEAEELKRLREQEQKAAEEAKKKEALESQRLQREENKKKWEEARKRNGSKKITFSDEPDVSGFYNPDDFYEFYYDEFFSYEDAESYYYDHGGF